MQWTSVHASMGCKSRMSSIGMRWYGCWFLRLDIDVRL